MCRLVVLSNRNVGDLVDLSWKMSTKLTMLWYSTLFDETGALNLKYGRGYIQQTGIIIRDKKEND